MTNYQLKVRRFNQNCVFELFWGKGQQLSSTLLYPESLTAFYQEWQRVYLSYYKSELRGWIEASGSVTTPPIDWHAKLVQTEAKLLSEFHHWLRSAELFEIRSIIARNQKSEDSQVSKLQVAGSKQQTINVFLTCYEIELERLPWEAWEIGTEFPTVEPIRITRTPVNIHQPTVSKQQRHPKRKARILAILGDDTGLNFQGDKEAVRSLSKIAEIEFVGWQPGQEIVELKAKISAAIADERGWDVLFFAGHSNETVLTGGEVAIAPNVSLSISEITPQLLNAKQRGLQFALFNSCSGLTLANSLIDLGLSQVAVMREPIHNAVAQVFLIRFLQGLAEHKDVHDSLLAACQYLKLSQNLTYPSAYLIPSLFCHPDAVLFQIKPFGFKEHLKRILPTPVEASAISALTLLSLSLPVQDFLLEKRLLTQAFYRQVTQQVPRVTLPPVLLVQIDEKSIREAKIAHPKPMNRKYLASLVDNLAVREARVIGIDYLLDRPQGENDKILAKSLQKAVARQPHPTWFVFASVRDDGEGWLKVLPEIATPNWSLQGHINLSRGYVSLVSSGNSAGQKLPFAYLLALAYRLNLEGSLLSLDPPQPPLVRGEQDISQSPLVKGEQDISQSPLVRGEQDISQSPKFRGGKEVNLLAQERKGEYNRINPKLSSQSDFFSQVTDYLRQEKGINYKTIFSPTAQRQPITNFSYGWRQMWLHPILDFSIPPAQVYQSIPAWQLLEGDSPQLRNLQQQVVMIVHGGYGEAGVFRDGEDNFALPAAIDYWFKQANPTVQRRRFTGGETHAYMVHNYLQQRLVVPIPDIWLIGLAILLGKGMTISLNKRQLRRALPILLAGTVVYGFVSLQAYISGALLLPWFFPVVTFWTYVLAVLLRKK